MKIAVYCQHVLGIGHLFRVLEIAKALAPHDVLLISGGRELDMALPRHIRIHRLPALVSDPTFGAWLTDDGRPAAEVLEERRQHLLRLLHQERPDVFLVELYPFGRKAFREELEPLLALLAARPAPACRVVCSLRDILVEKDQPAKHEARAVATLNRWFDLLLIHADPSVVRLEATFSRVADIRVPIRYTGFVAPPPPEGERTFWRGRLGIPSGERLVVASAGGGKVGGDLLRATAAALARLPGRPRVRLQIFTGPFADPALGPALEQACPGHIRAAAFTPELRGWLTAADLSLSMAGYNTCMDLLVTGVPALAWPLAINREQPLRAELLARRGYLRRLETVDLEPTRLAGVMEATMNQPPRPQAPIDLQGAQASADLITAPLRTGARP
jgi:predicted glycosyltransferase